MSKVAKGQYHFVGVAGVGMSAIAQAVLAQGNTVTGSDRDFDTGKDLDVIRKLQLAGVTFVPQDGSGVAANTAGVVVSTAIENDNPDLVAAGRLNVPVLHRAEMLAMLVDGTCCIAITGTSGKSTVTGMTGWLLDQLGADPVVVNGAPVLNWCDERRIGNMRYGGANYWVIEADESDKSLLRYHPDWAVITNVSKDHFELDETVELFQKFASQVRNGIVSVLQDPGLFDDFAPVVSGGGSVFHYKGTEFVVPVPGRHNAEDAMYAIMICERLGFSLDRIKPALKSFKGIHRRLEKVGEAGGITVIDDYGHNPAKIRAAWVAMAQSHNRVIGVWRPHGYRPLVTMMNDLAEMFGEVCRPADHLFVLPVYDAGGTADRSIKSENFVELLRNRSIPASFSSGVDSLVDNIKKMAKPGDVVITMGARDPQLPETARRIFKAVCGC